MNYLELGIDISKIKGSGKTLCPKCSHTRKKKMDPCLSVNLKEGLWFCHNCEWKGSIKTQEVVEKKYFKPEWKNVTDLPEKTVKWFSARGISQQTLIQAKITTGEEWMPQINAKEKTIQFPYFQDGELINIKYRGAKKSFKMVKDAKLIFCNIDSIKDSDYAIITEGEMDMLSYMEIGEKPVISVPNGASKGGQLEYLDNTIECFKKLKTIFLALDDDEPGRALRDELARRLGYHRCRKVTFKGFKDANELLQSDPTLLQETIEEAVEYPVEGIYTASDIWEGVLALRRDGLKPGCGTTILQLNELITFDPGYVTVITGIPNHGKSEFLDQVVIDLNLLHEWKVGVFSPENYPLELHFSKIASKITGKHFNSLDEKEMDKVKDYFDDNFFFIMPEEDLTLESILDKAKHLVEKHGIKTLVIDAWNKLEHKFNGNETQYVSKQLDVMDLFCRINKVHLFLVAHPTKIKKDKDGNFEIPTLYDISGSANFYNKPANGISVYRRFFADGDSHTEIYVQKIKFKHWGKQGSTTLRYDTISGRYYYLTKNQRNYLDDRPVKDMYIPTQPIPHTPPVVDVTQAINISEGEEF